jgi:hypothetical protein
VRGKCWGARDVSNLGGWVGTCSARMIGCISRCSLIRFDSPFVACADAFARIRFDAVCVLPLRFDGTSVPSNSLRIFR